MTNESATVCECNHLTTFAGGWVVVPNTIDWNYVFNNFDFYKNPTLYVTESVILIVYIIAVIWARHKDKKDIQLVRTVCAVSYTHLTLPTKVNV